MCTDVKGRYTDVKERCTDVKECVLTLREGVLTLREGVLTLRNVTRWESEGRALDQWIAHEKWPVQCANLMNSFLVVMEIRASIVFT